MKVFVERINLITGLPEYVSIDENFDEFQEIARSNFADMLHDTERNQMYEAALKVAIDKIHEKGKEAIVLDIGTGTGLLSMMAVRNGADKVIACEAFDPISECALQVIALNGFEDQIEVIPKKSVDLKVGENEDLEEKCNILVTEVFDTELIGEGALATFNHANKYLLTEDCIVIPHSATIYAQIVECPIVDQWNSLSNVHDRSTFVDMPDRIKKCGGSSTLYDFQMSQLPEGSFKTLMKPTPVFEFDWTSQSPYERSAVLTGDAECDGEAQAVFVWWDLKMDVENKIILSCAPYWAHPLYKNDRTVKMPWRDHWMQAAYFPTQRKFKKGDQLSLIASHDEYSMWFDVKKGSNVKKEDSKIRRCRCFIHTLPRNRIGQMNDEYRKNVFMNVFNENNISNKNVLILGHGFFLSFMALKFNANQIIIFDDHVTNRSMENFLPKSKLAPQVVLINNIRNLLEMVDKNFIDVVIAEPYFLSSVLPWDDFYIYHLLNQVKPILKDDAQIFPKAAIVKAIAVKFDDLHKIRAPLKVCEGFQMAPFDELVKVNQIKTLNLQIFI